MLYRVKIWTILEIQEDVVITSIIRYLRKLIEKTRRERIRNAAVSDKLEQMSVVE